MSPESFSLDSVHEADQKNSPIVSASSFGTDEGRVSEREDVVMVDI